MTFSRARFALAAFLLNIPGLPFYSAAAANVETRPIEAIAPQLAPIVMPEASAALSAETAQPQAAITEASGLSTLPSLQSPNASAGEVGAQAGAPFDGVLSAKDGDAPSLPADPSAPADKDGALLGLIRQGREPGEALGPTDAQQLGRKLGLSGDQTWSALGRLSARGHLALFSNAYSLVVDLPKADADDEPAVEGRELAVAAVRLLNSDAPVDHLRALAMLHKAYLKFPKDSGEAAADESRKQIGYLRLNAALEVVRDALAENAAKAKDAGATQKGMIEDARKYFTAAYYDPRHVPFPPEKSVAEVAADAVGRFDLSPYRGKTDLKPLELALALAKSAAQQPAPKGAVAPAAAEESGKTVALLTQGEQGPDAKRFPARAPVMALNGVWFPETYSNVKLTVEDKDAFATLTKAVNGGGFMIAATYAEGQGTKEKHHPVATLVRVYDIEMDGKKMTARFDPIRSVTIAGYEKDKEGTLYAKASYPPSSGSDRKKMEGLAAAARQILSQFGSVHPEIKPYIVKKAIEESRPEALANILAQDLPFSTRIKQELLSAPSLEKRLERGVMELMGLVRSKWNAGGPSGEGGEDGGRIEDIDQLKARLDAIGMPDAIRKVAIKEFSRLAEMNPKDAEAQKLRAYVDWLVELPWAKRAEDRYEPEAARKSLDEGHTGLEEVKERILEYLAVRKLTGSKKGAVILFVGPKGTGKTSIASKIAKALGRPMVRLSLGGIRDVTDLKGHNRTYLGSQPGAIIKLMKDAGVNNPLFLLDEIDKMDDNPVSGGAKASLLETLDPKQNDTFRDTYMEVPYDLSQVIWIVTANTLETIPEPLRDRMEIIEFAGYTPLEKLGIARNHILAERAVENGLKVGQVQVTDAALRMIIEGYTREAGVRKLYEQVDKLFRKIAAWNLTKGEPIPAVVDAGDVRKYLGVERYHLEDTLSNGVGVMTGLAVTGDVGGSTLNIEVVTTPGKGELIITGNLKDVMKESTRAAYTFVKSRAKQLGIPEDAFSKLDIHVHFPDGATPKDGPSAGLAIAAAVASRLTGRPIKPGFAMTGEIDIVGNALPIGGLMQKSMGAHRAGMHTVIFPEANTKDVSKIPEEVRKDLNLVPVKSADQVLELLLEPAAAAPRTSGFVWWKPWTWFARR